ncbi:MAG: TlpA family protein disulfide reductase, partial [Betaproteobacteria bacterium]|nr:TlpA family protein disulfide reductase [Betaproteobacteria bacterium]
GLTLSGIVAPMAMAIEEGARAQAYDIHLMNGQSFSSGEGTGKVVMLHFWATWCVPCREEQFPRSIDS